MSSVARAVWEARLFTSWATTAKPRPASPARAASIVALSASRLVWPAMSRIRPRIDSIASTWPDSAWLTFTAWLGLVAGAGRDVGGDLDFGPGILDRADQAGRGLRGFAHRDRRLLGGGSDFAGLAEHAAGRGGGGAGALGQRLGLVAAGADQLADAALELFALAAARVGGFVGLEQRDLGENDVLGVSERAVEGVDRGQLVFGLAIEAVLELGDHVTRHVGVGGDEFRDAVLAGRTSDDALFGARADPGWFDRLGEVGAIELRRPRRRNDGASILRSRLRPGPRASAAHPGTCRRRCRPSAASVTCSSVRRCRCPMSPLMPRTLRLLTRCWGRHAHDNG